MKKLYKVRLFRVMDPVAPYKYEVYGAGTIIVFNKKKDCKEFFYKLDIPILDSKLEHDDKNNIPMNLLTIPNEKLKRDYVVLKEDFKDKNRIKNKRELLEYNFDSRTNYTMDIIKRLKEFEEFEKGVVYEKRFWRR